MIVEYLISHNVILMMLGFWKLQKSCENYLWISRHVTSLFL